MIEILFHHQWVEENKCGRHLIEFNARRYLQDYPQVGIEHDDFINQIVASVEKHIGGLHGISFNSRHTAVALFNDPDKAMLFKLKYGGAQ